MRESLFWLAVLATVHHGGERMVVGAEVRFFTFHLQSGGRKQIESEAES